MEQSYSDSQAQAEPPRQRLLLNLRDTLSKWAGVHLKGFLDKLDQELFRLADKADNNADQSRYWQTRAELVSHRDTIEQRMSERLRQAYQAFLDSRETWQLDLPVSVIGENDLSLMEEEQLEQTLAVDTMSRRTAADCSESLYALHQRLSVLATGHKITEHGNPVAPRVFAEALEWGIAPLTIDNRARLLIYKLYENQLMHRLNKLYDLLNHQLKSAGVLSNLRHTIKKQKELVLPAELAGFASAASQQNQRQLMEAIRELQGSTPATSGGVSSLQLLATLGNLQKTGAGHLLEANNSDAVILTGNQFQQQVKKETSAAVDTDVIEIVGLLFEYMLNDEQLPDTIKALLSYLHTPFLKVALLDKAFFNTPQHPARQLLNSLAGAGERWVDPDNRRRSDVYLQIKKTVQRVLDEFDQDISLFSELLGEFNEFLHQYVQRIRRAEQRALEAASGEDRLKESRQQVQRFLNERCAGLSLTSAAHKLLFGPWAQYQAFVWLRHGTESEAWISAEKTVDLLLDYLNGDSRERQQHEPPLLEHLHHALNTVGYDKVKGEALLQALTRSSSAGEKVTVTPQQEAPTDDSGLRELTRLEFGTWFLFGANQPRKQHKRLKLAWYNDRTLHFMFVNQMGQQVAVKHGSALAQELKDGSARILGNLDDKPFFEKALERIAEQLKGRHKKSSAT